MSFAILKESLSIVEEDLPDKSKKGQKRRSCNDDINDVRRGKYLNCKKKQLTVADIKKERQRNRAEENVAKLLKLSETSVKVGDKVAEKLFKGKDKATSTKEPKEESIFTEEDFKAFEKEYFPE